MTENQAASEAPTLLRGAGAASDYVQRRSQDGIALLALAGPEGNRFGPDLTAALERAFAVALDDPGIRAVVILGRGPDFCAGAYADLPPPGPEPAQVPPVLAAFARLCDALADSPKPVVCALHGRVASGGLALALAADARLADPRAALHFPDPRLGRLPPGNAAVRLAWLVGAQAALRFLQAEAPVPAAAAMDGGLIDAVETDDLIAAALRRAAALALDGPKPARTFPGLADGPGFAAGVAAARRVLPAPLPDHRQHEAMLIDVIEAAQLLPPDQALAYDLTRARDAVVAPPARALAHLARAARRVLETPETRATGHLPGQPLGTILATLPPAEAALLIPPLLRRGEKVVLSAGGEGALNEALEAVALTHFSAVERGQLSQERAEAQWTRLEGRLHPDPQSPPAAALATPELAALLSDNLPTPVPFLIWGGRETGPDMPAESIAIAPAPVRNRAGMAKLAELVVGGGTTERTVLRAMDFALALRMTPLRVAETPVLPTMLRAAMRACERLAGAGVALTDILATGLLPPAALSPAATGATGAPLPALSPERLIVLALVNTGAKLLQGAQVLRPSDLDLAMVLGAGYPNWRGGPMAEADSLGPLVLRHELLLAAELDPGLWAPAPLIDELIRQSWRFEDLNTD